VESRRARAGWGATRREDHFRDVAELVSQRGPDRPCETLVAWARSEYPPCSTVWTFDGGIASHGVLRSEWRLGAGGRVAVSPRWLHSGGRAARSSASG
jgi:hypothetical protein